MPSGPIRFLGANGCVFGVQILKTRSFWLSYPGRTSSDPMYFLIVETDRLRAMAALVIES
jgi:hypothetical protein